MRLGKHTCLQDIVQDSSAPSFTGYLFRVGVPNFCQHNLTQTVVCRAQYAGRMQNQLIALRLSSSDLGECPHICRQNATCLLHENSVYGDWGIPRDCKIN